MSSGEACKLVRFKVLFVVVTWTLHALFLVSGKPRVVCERSLLVRFRFGWPCMAPWDKTKIITPAVGPPCLRLIAGRALPLLLINKGTSPNIWETIWVLHMPGHSDRSSALPSSRCQDRRRYVETHSLQKNCTCLVCVCIYKCYPLAA